MPQDKSLVYIQQAKEFIREIIDDHKVAGSPTEILFALLAGFHVQVAEEYRKIFGGDYLKVATMLYNMADNYATHEQAKKQLKIPEYRNQLKNNNPPKKEAA